MSSYPNLFPLGALRVPFIIKQNNRNPFSQNYLDHFIGDAVDINFQVHGFITQGTNPSDIEAVDGYRYILGENFSDNDAFKSGGNVFDKWRESAPGNDVTDDAGVNDIIVYHRSVDQDGDGTFEGAWELLFDASNSVFGSKGGALVYSIPDGQFYGFTGGGWGDISSGTEGEKGATGTSVVFGRGYTFEDTASSVNTAGEVFVEEGAVASGQRRIKLHRNAHSTSGFAGASGDLASIFFPQGSDAVNDPINPAVTLFLYNEDTEKMYAVRIKAKSDALVGNILNFQSSDHYSSYEVLEADSGVTTAWPADDWQDGHSIGLLAIADGALGATGATGVSGAGITLAATSPETNDEGLEELVVQFIGSDGSLGATQATGIVSGTAGTTGEAGEIGFQMSFTGGQADQWENNSNVAVGTALTAQGVDGGITLTDGEIHYVSEFFVDNDPHDPLPGGGLTGTTQDYILMSNFANEITDGSEIYPALGLESGEYNTSDGTVARSNPGELYFYIRDNYQLRLKSFVSYEKIIANQTGAERLVLKDVNDEVNGGDLGLTGAGQLGFVLPVPRGVRGQGVTFGKVENNELFLDYIDSDGNTFGRFGTGIKGITGNQGSLNPFNILYGVTVDDENENGTISVKSRDSITQVATSVRVDGLDLNGITVSDYIQFGDDLQNFKGFITVFNNTDVTQFGIFRFSGIATDGDDALFSGLSHKSGPITAIYDNQNISGTTGFTLGAEVRFAINTDGAKGEGGETGIGFTYGNEYFIATKENKPNVRTNGDPLEIGDKWFCSDVGLEFTFLGATGVTGTVVHGPTGNGLRWVQTNNARQGSRGPAGPKGDPGVGEAGVTGVNFEGAWQANNYKYEKNDVVTITLAAATAAAGPIGQGIVEQNWNAYFNNNLGIPGIQQGAFICIQAHNSSNSTVPGIQSLLNGPRWRSLVFSDRGPSGDAGATGITGAGFTAPAVSEEGEFTIDQVIYTPQGGANTSTLNVGNILGPTGATGPVAGDDGEFIFNSAGKAAGSDKLTTSAGQVILNQYRTPPNTAGLDPSSQTIFADNTAASTYKHTMTTDLVSKIDIGPSTGQGASVTLFLKGVEGASFASPLEIVHNSVNAATSVYVSRQSAINPSKIVAPQGGEAAVMTISEPEGDSSVAYINYVLMKKS